MKVYWEMTAARFFILGIIIFPLLMFIQPFIGCWLGIQYQLEEVIVYLLIFNLFIRLQPAAVYIFIGLAHLVERILQAHYSCAVLGDEALGNLEYVAV